MGLVCPPFDYLATCSEPGLQSYELSRLNQAANLRKELRQLMDRWIECEVEARMARLILESRRIDIRPAAAPPEAHFSSLPQQLSLPLAPPDTAVPSAEHRGNPQSHKCGERELRGTRAAAAKLPSQGPAPNADGAAENAAPAPPYFARTERCQPRLLGELAAHRNLQMFVRQQANDSLRCQHSIHEKERLGPSPRGDQTKPHALPCAGRRVCIARAPKAGCFVVAKSVASGVSARTSSLCSGADRRDQQPRDIPKSCVRRSIPLERQRPLLRATGFERPFCNDYLEPYSSLCAVQ